MQIWFPVIICLCVWYGYLQVFEVMEDSVGVLSPKYNLEPPHYDGIQSLCLMGDLLFTGSRDTCIKKWDLAEQQQKHVSCTTVLQKKTERAE